MRRSFAVVVLLVFALPGRAEPVDWWQMPAEEFFHRPEANAQIDPVTFDRALLSAAIFHRTNTQRRQLGLGLFLPLAKASEAADIQAKWNAVIGAADHKNPIPNLEGPMERARHAGLDPALVGENIAITPIYDIGSATHLAIRQEGVRQVYLDPVTGKAVKVHTYASFAASLVARWMTSPGHRANIVNPAYEYLGCSARPTRGIKGADLLCSAQVFVTLRGSRRTKSE